MEQLLVYGLFEKKLKHISEVENGILSKCFCPNCNHPLVAKNNPNNKKASHFAHKSGKECEGAIETALHLLAKDVLEKTKRLKTPKYHFDYNPQNEKSIFKKSVELRFENIILEKTLDINGMKIKPDAIGEIGGKQILIEFANTHLIDNDKKRKLEILGIACIEINLSNQLLDRTSLETFFNTDTHLKYWVINQRLDKEYADFKAKEKEEQKLRDIIRQKEIDNNRIKNEEKINKYRYNKQFKVLLAQDEQVKKCPLKKAALKEMTNSRFYKQPILKRIIDGEFWNGEIYGYVPNGKWIFIGKEKVTVFPPDNKEQSETESKFSKFLFAGLKEIKDSIQDPSFGDCSACSHYLDYFYVEEKDYFVCNHP